MKKEKRSGNGRWIIIIIILAGLFFISIIAAGILSIALMGSQDYGAGNTAVIPVSGVIVTSSDEGLFSAGTASSSDIVKLIEKADDSSAIKAIVLEVNSPGGSPVATDEISQAIKATDKPTVAWIRESGASGAYWIASSCDHIVANRMSVVGSIGVIGSYLDFSGLINRYNVSYERLVAGKYKDAGTPYRELTDEERQIFQTQLDELHDIFIEEVSENRGLDKAKVKAVATGMVYLGKDAKDLGLVDELGGKAEALSYVERTLNITAHPVEYRTEKTFYEMLFSAISTNSFYLGKGMGESMFSDDSSSTKSQFMY